MEAKIIIVTGASGAIGAEISRALLAQGHFVVMACRNLEKGQRVLDAIWTQKPGEINRAKLMELDMASFESVRRFVAEIREAKLPIDGVINNAGTTMRQFLKTNDGLETTLQTNYVSVFLLNKLLIPFFEPNAAIVNVNSLAKKSQLLTTELFDRNVREFSQIGAYRCSKTALTVYTADLAARTAGQFRVNLADPGIVNSDIIRLGRWFDFLADLLFRPFTKSPRSGSRPILNAFFTKESGKQFAGKGAEKIDKKYVNHFLRAWLWDKTEAVVTEK